ncbi:hypothetical protein MA16_Dca025414 [Dendrobium catenatum]|uniref:RNase H type-1 domain-containing protein n=1 Tax=Dendrobium catenatum TaxID=906689 RepID=A0A2I0WID1_9ASPA|nr:hypothetical protein MA16_Dca025414 [Dendrobium catenatum]
MTCVLQFDGASKGNPGMAGAAAVLRNGDGSVLPRFNLPTPRTSGRNPTLFLLSLIRKPYSCAQNSSSNQNIAAVDFSH